MRDVSGICKDCLEIFGKDIHNKLVIDAELTGINLVNPTSIDAPNYSVLIDEEIEVDVVADDVGVYSKCTGRIKAKFLNIKPLYGKDNIELSSDLAAECDILRAVDILHNTDFKNIRISDRSSIQVEEDTILRNLNVPKLLISTTKHAATVKLVGCNINKLDIGSKQIVVEINECVEEINISHSTSLVTRAKNCKIDLTTIMYPENVVLHWILTNCGEITLDNVVSNFSKEELLKELDMRTNPAIHYDEVREWLLR